MPFQGRGAGQNGFRGSKRSCGDGWPRRRTDFFFFFSGLNMHVSVWFSICSICIVEYFNFHANSQLIVCFSLVCCTCCKIITESMQGVTSLSVISEKKKRYSPLIYTDPCHPSCHPHDTVLLKSVKTPSELHTSLDRGENQI